MNIIHFGLFVVLFVLIGNAELRIARNADNFVGSSVLDEVPLIDGHNDLPNNLYELEHDILSNFTLNSDLRQNPKWAASKFSHTDLPRLRQGKVGGQFWVAYVSCEAKDAVALTMDQIDTIKRLIDLNSDDMEFVSTADGITDAFNRGKIASLIAVEGGHSIDSRLGVLRLFYELGVRYLTLTHNCNLPWADENRMDNSINQNATKIGGLSEWGKKVIHEMNRLGMMVDLSHVAKQVMIDAIDSSVAPVIFSHSNSWQIYAHARNVQDDVLEKLKLNKGIVMVNFYTVFLTAEETSSIEDVIRHLEHLRSIVGIDHVGIGGDYDGVDSQPIGLEDVSKYPALFDALADRGWTRDDLRKLAGLNLIRVFKEVESVRDSLRNEKPFDVPVPIEDMIANKETFACRTKLPKLLSNTAD